MTKNNVHILRQKYIFYKINSGIFMDSKTIKLYLVLQHISHIQKAIFIYE